jgi:hypothetical protein
MSYACFVRPCRFLNPLLCPFYLPASQSSSLKSHPRITIQSIPLILSIPLHAVFGPRLHLYSSVLDDDHIVMISRRSRLLPSRLSRPLTVTTASHLLAMRRLIAQDLDTRYICLLLIRVRVDQADRFTRLADGCLSAAPTASD